MKSDGDIPSEGVSACPGFSRRAGRSGTLSPSVDITGRSTDEPTPPLPTPITSLFPPETDITLLHHLLTSTRCLLWVAEVTEGPSVPDATGDGFYDPERKTRLTWKLSFLSEETVFKWLPVVRRPGQTLRAAFWDSRSPADQERCNQNASRALRDGAENYQQEFRCETPDGVGCWFLETVQISPLERMPGERRWRLSGVCVDITERKRTEEQLVYQGRHDSLTGLPNRMYLTEMLKKALEETRKTGEQAALLFVDMDNFKLINDSLGHAAGDEVLMVLARRLRTCVRPGDIVARLGGDEFTILMTPAPSDTAVRSAALRIAAALQVPIPLQGQTIFPACSIGIAFSGDTPDAGAAPARAADFLLRNADSAMYYAKTIGKGRVERFQTDMNARALEQLEMGSELRRSVEAGDLALHYQPILDLATGCVCEIEALARWNHPRLGPISPERFVPVAEETGCIIALGLWVLREACRQMKRWHDALPSVANDLTISVNLSVRQLQDPHLVRDVTQILSETRLPPTALKLEITETAMMLDAAANRQTVHALRALGVKIAMDDFGIGYSSMAYLDYLPVDTIKIDRTFIQRLGSGVLREESDAIVRAIIAMAKAMGIAVTSEGIEGPEQLRHLQAMECDRGQGHYFARPLTGDDMATFLRDTLPAG